MTECQGACLMFKSSNSFENKCLSSALSIMIGLVPNIILLFRYKGRAKLFGIWPLIETIKPRLFYSLD